MRHDGHGASGMVRGRHDRCAGPSSPGAPCGPQPAGPLHGRPQAAVAQAGPPPPAHGPPPPETSSATDRVPTRVPSTPPLRTPPVLWRPWGPARSPRRAESARRGRPAGARGAGPPRRRRTRRAHRRDATDRCRGPPGRVWRERGGPLVGAGHVGALCGRAGSYENLRPPRMSHDRLGDRADQEAADTAEATTAEHQHLGGLRLGQQTGGRGPRDHVRADVEVGVALDQLVHRSAQGLARPVSRNLKLRQGRVVTGHPFPGVHKTQEPPAQQGFPRRPVRGGQALGDPSVPTTTGRSMIRPPVPLGCGLSLPSIT